MRKQGFDWIGIGLYALLYALVFFALWLPFKHYGLADVPLSEATIGEVVFAACLVWFAVWATGVGYPKRRG